MVEQNKMQPGRGGCIINMSSVNAVMAIPTIAGYNASKGGVNNLTRYTWHGFLPICLCNTVCDTCIMLLSDYAEIVNLTVQFDKSWAEHYMTTLYGIIQ